MKEVVNIVFFFSPRRNVFVLPGKQKKSPKNTQDSELRGLYCNNLRSGPNPHMPVYRGGETSLCQKSWFKRILLSLVINHGCVLGVTCNKPIRVPFPFQFKTFKKLGGLAPWRIAIMILVFIFSNRERFSAEETWGKIAALYGQCYCSFFIKQPNI